MIIKRELLTYIIKEYLSANQGINIDPENITYRVLTSYDDVSKTVTVDDLFVVIFETDAAPKTNDN